jgi:hypothetical protein
MASWVYLPEQLRAHPALVGTELYAYRTGNRIILPPSEDVVRDIDTILDRLTCEDDEAWIYAHFLRFRVNEWVQKYGTYQGFGELRGLTVCSAFSLRTGEHPIPSTNPANETVEQGTARSPVRAPEPRMSGADLEGHHEVYSKIGARVSKKKVRPRQPVPDKEFYAGTDMYLCKKRKSACSGLSP